MASNAKARSKVDWIDIIRAVTTPLGFYVLALLIIEGTLTIVLSCAKLAENHVWDGFLVMLGTFAVVVLIVTILTVWFPKNLLYGKEEHANPVLAPSALKDQIEDLIAVNVRSECLKNPPK